jgi:DNA mismatch repair protein MutS2
MISERTLQTLEFPKIREQLARHTSFSASRTLALSLAPTTDPAEVVQRLRQTSESRHLLDIAPETGTGGARDIRSQADRAARGGTLEASDFLPIASTLSSMRQLRDTLERIDAETFPLLSEYQHDLPRLPDIEQEITCTIGEDGTVADSASPALGRIRGDIRTTEIRMQERLNTLVNTARFEGILQENIVTVRNGRYVVPVKAPHRRAVPGLVHDQSSSGATLYIEPMAVVEMNNRLRKLQLDEEDEVARILGHLSQRVGSVAEQIIAGVASLAMLDLFFARARYALALRCVEPEITDSESYLPPDTFPLHLVEARHPLLDQKNVVPITVWMGAEFRFLLITGPNTGGKTVVLKTVGLLALMAQSGLHIPARAPSRVTVFGQVFADIGDEQSIEQNLSTFSSHMTTIIRMLNEIEQLAEAGKHWQPTLVLLDEIGAGTDPAEGTALARAILEHLVARNCLGIVTTHYAELKVFAYNTAGIQNASVEFDAETLAPTYELTIGLPGRSNALAIAARLGLSSTIIEQASSSMSQETVHLEGLLEDIRRKHEEAETERQRAAELRQDAEKYRGRLADELAVFEATRQERLEQAFRGIEDELREARAELHRMRKEARNSPASRQKIQETEQQVQQVREYVEHIQQQAKPELSETSETSLSTPLQVGETVLVRSIGLSGEIVSLDEEDGSAEVQVGGFRVQANLSELRREPSGSKGKSGSAGKLSPSSPYSPPSSGRAVSLPAAPDVSISLDMRGWHTADVAEGLERYLNDAYLAGLPEVRLIHGKGTGALRQAVHEFLRSHPLVASFRSGGNEGGEGVSLVRLVAR